MDMRTLQHLRMDNTRFWRNCCGSWFHSWNKAYLRSNRKLGSPPYSKTRPLWCFGLHFPLICPSECGLVCAWPPFLCTTCTQMCEHVKYPISICRKRVGLIASWMETRKQCIQGKQQQLGSVVLWLFAFPGEHLKFPVYCIGTRKLSHLILHSLNTYGSPTIASATTTANSAGPEACLASGVESTTM